jgi:indolepyruvate ferredoxin oxidoreductase, beta subunit
LKTVNILLGGVGGQGIVSASDILADMALSRGYDVKKSEIHGMSQRGGSVSSFVRYGDKIYSPLPFRDSVDYILSFEEMESLRYREFINPGTKIFINLKKIKTAAMTEKGTAYPDVKTALKTENAYFLEAAAEAKKIGNEKVEGSIMLGALCFFCGVYRSGVCGRAFKKNKEIHT